MVELNFTVDPNMQSGGGGDWQPLEPGDYTGSIVDASQKTSQTGNKYLAVQVTIEGKGSVWDNLNLWHSNPKAVSIASEKLNAIGKAVGLGHIADTEQLLAKTVTISVGAEPDQNGKTRNTILHYKSAAAPPVAAPAVAPSSTAAAAPVAQGNPWTA